MSTRMNYSAVNPAAFKAMLGLEQFVGGRGLNKELLELIKLRASLINGCAFCANMHSKDMLKMGMTFERITLVSVWRESPCYSDAERAVLELTERVTKLPENGVPQETYDRVLEHYTEEQFVDILMAINAINGWNRLAVSTGMHADV